jgi:hypothetical protein
MVAGAESTREDCIRKILAKRNKIQWSEDTGNDFSWKVIGINVVKSSKSRGISLRIEPLGT